jgi:hypothetical protein
VYVNTYLPDELGEWAKEAGISFSGLLRQAVEEERKRAGREPGSKISEGVYRRKKPKGGYDIQIHINTAIQAKGNGINLMPSDPLPEPPSGRLSLLLTEAQVKRLYAAVSEARD